MSAPPLTASSPPRLSVGQSTARGALAMLTTQPFTWAGSLLTTIALPRLMGAESMGQFITAITIVGLASTIASLGVSDFLVRRVAQQPRSLQHDSEVALLLQMITAGLAALVLIVASPLAEGVLGDLRLLYVVIVGLFMAPAQTVLLSSFRGREMHKTYAWFNAAGSVIGQVAGVLALLAGGGVIGFAAVSSATSIVVIGVAWKLSGVRVAVPQLDRHLLAEFWEFIRGGLPFLVASVTLTISGGIDRVLLAAFVPVGEVGWYSAAFRIVAIPIFIPTTIITPLFPALSRSVHDPEAIRRTMARTLRVVMLLMIPLSAGTIVIAPAVPSLLGWPADFEHSVPLIALLSLQMPIIAVDMVLSVVLVAVGRQKRWVAVGVAAAVMNVLVNLALIPLFENRTGSGAVGASLVTVATELMMLSGALVLIPRNLLDMRTAWDAVRISIAGVATVVVGVVLLPYALVLGIVGGALIYVVTAVGLRALTLEDIQLLKTALGSRSR